MARGSPRRQYPRIADDEVLLAIPLEVEDEVVRLVAASVSELQASQVPLLYKERTGIVLDFKKYGFIRLTDFLAHIDRVVVVARGTSGFIVQLQTGVRVPRKLLEQRKVDECDLDKKQYSRVCFAPIGFNQVTEPIRTAFRCALCFYLVVCPLITPCGHLFCAQCVLTERCRSRQTIRRQRYRRSGSLLPAERTHAHRYSAGHTYRPNGTDNTADDDVNSLVICSAPDSKATAEMLATGIKGPQDICCYYWCPVCACILDWDSSLSAVSPRSTLGVLESLWRLLAAVSIKCSEEQCKWTGNYSRWFNHVACCDYRSQSTAGTDGGDLKTGTRRPGEQLGLIDEHFEALVSKHRSLWKDQRMGFSLHVRKLLAEAALGFLDNPSVCYAGCVATGHRKKTAASQRRSSIQTSISLSKVSYDEMTITLKSLLNSATAKLLFWSEDWRHFEIQFRAAFAQTPRRKRTHRHHGREDASPSSFKQYTQYSLDSPPVQPAINNDSGVHIPGTVDTTVLTTCSAATAGDLVEEQVSVPNRPYEAIPQLYIVAHSDPKHYFAAGEQVYPLQFEHGSGWVLLASPDNSKCEWCPLWVLGTPSNS